MTSINDIRHKQREHAHAMKRLSQDSITIKKAITDSNALMVQRVESLADHIRHELHKLYDRITPYDPKLF